MIKDRVLFIGLCSLVLGVGIYFAKDAFKSSSDRQSPTGTSIQDSLLAGSTTNTLAAFAPNCSFPGRAGEAPQAPQKSPVILNEIASLRPLR